MSKVQIFLLILLSNAFLRNFVLSQEDKYGCFIDADNHNFHDCKMCRVGMDCGLMNGMRFKCNTIPECPVEYTYSSQYECRVNCPPPYFGCSRTGCKNCNSQNCDDVKTGQFYSSREDCRASCDTARSPTRRCGKNQVFTMCKRCEPTCEKTFFSKCNSYFNCKQGCRCRKGLVRHLSSCITPSQCPKCNEYSEFRYCPYEGVRGCPRTCEYPNGVDDEAVCFRSKGCMNRKDRLGGCECQHGRIPVSYINNTCVPEQWCPRQILYFCNARTGVDRCGRCLTIGPNNPCPTNVVAYQSPELCLDHCDPNTYVVPEFPAPPDESYTVVYFCQAPVGFDRCRPCRLFQCPENIEPYPFEQSCLANCNLLTFVEPIFPRYYCERFPQISETDIRCGRCSGGSACPINVELYADREFCASGGCNSRPFVEPILGTEVSILRFFCQDPTGFRDRCRSCIRSRCPRSVELFAIESICNIACAARPFVEPIFPTEPSQLSFFCKNPTRSDRCEHCIPSECPTNVMLFENEPICHDACDEQPFVEPIFPDLRIH